ncbi:hypothetical protein GGS21DRAFT_544833 [Xylaria nigripes]|nr:hypothetical protein GGS21DRAFT_544833 [Xylaria nigripes]
MATTDAVPAPSCGRCKEQDGVLDLRSETVCQTCFISFVASKAIKRLEVLQRETRGSKLPSRPQRYLLALSRGPSSTALLHILSENMRRQRERNQRAKFEVVAVFVDIDVDTDDRGRNIPSSSPGPDPSTDPFAAQFPEIPIHIVPLSSILSSPVIDWSSLPAQNTTLPPPQRLADLLTRLPTTSARTDVSRLLTRHALFAAAAAHDCPVVLLGYNTTALAELTLSETAKGRGFGIPWFVNDGAFPLPLSVDGDGAVSAPVYIYSPLREVFRKEILTYLSVAGALADLFPAAALEAGGGVGAVVSHRDLSIDDVVARYFVDVEASYPSVVANVVRTTGKLSRTAPGGSDTQMSGGDAKEEGTGRWCGLCGVGLDPAGDERWKGEIGETGATILGAADGDSSRRSKLCYGCERSVKG